MIRCSRNIIFNVENSCAASYVFTVTSDHINASLPKSNRKQAKSPHTSLCVVKTLMCLNALVSSVRQEQETLFPVHLHIQTWKINSCCYRLHWKISLIYSNELYWFICKSSPCGVMQHLHYGNMQMFCFHSWIYQPMFRRKLHLLWSTNTHIWLTERASACSMHTHTHIIIYLRLGGPLTHSYALTLHACMQPTMNTCPLPHYLMITAECQERLNPEAQWLRSATDTKALFQTLVNVYRLSSTVN